LVTVVVTVLLTDVLTDVVTVIGVVSASTGNRRRHNSDRRASQQ